MTVERIGEATLYTADILEALRSMADESVHCVMTSPPYWGLRDYGQAGQIGLEPTPEAYVARMVEVFAEVRRVLRADGTCWVNLGDSYATGGAQMTGYNEPDWIKTGGRCEGGERRAAGRTGLKPKDLVGIPWRVAFALQADGWYLRSDIIWAKPNPMPESCTDRPTKAHEYLFLLSKSPRYFYDAEAVRESAEPRNDERPFGNAGGNRHGDEGRTYKSKKPDGWDTGTGGHGSVHRNGREHGEAAEIRYGRNRRTVWTIATQPYPEAHFATFPEKLVEPCVLAGCPAQVCPECGAPWERVVEKSYEPTDRTPAPNKGRLGAMGERAANMTRDGFIPNRDPVIRTTGFRPTCAHDKPPVPGTFLDPFCGSGTALLVALRLGRRAVGIELKPEYMALARKRIEAEAAQVKMCL